MKWLWAALVLLIGAIGGALLLPMPMLASFYAFAQGGGDLAHLLRRFQGVNGTPEAWARSFYVFLGVLLGGLTGYLLLCLRSRSWQTWALFCRRLVLLLAVSLCQSWFKLLTDGYNTPAEALVLLWLPTLWFAALLLFGVWKLKSLPRSDSSMNVWQNGVAMRDLSLLPGSGEMGQPKSDEELKTLLGEMTRATRLRWVTLLGVAVELLLLLSLLPWLIGSPTLGVAQIMAVALLVAGVALLFFARCFVKTMQMNCTLVDVGGYAWPYEINTRFYRLALTAEGLSWSQLANGKKPQFHVSYEDIDRAEVIKIGAVYYLKFAGTESVNRSPALSLLPVKPKDCSVLLHAIARQAPQAQLNDFAVAFGRGIYPPLTR